MLVLLLLIFNQFELYYQHNFGKKAYIISFYDLNGDNHKDLLVHFYSSSGYYDSLLLYSLPTNQRLAKYLSSPYQSVNFLAYLGNRRVLIWRYSYNQNTGRYMGKVYYYENYENLVWTSSDITSNNYIICNALDINGDNMIDISISYTNPDTSTVFLIYRGNVLDISQKESKERKKIILTNQILLSLPEKGNYEIDFYDVAGRKWGTYFLEGKKGENIITLPFMMPALTFYIVKEENKIIFQGKIVNQN